MRASEVRAGMRVALGKRNCMRPLEAYILSLDRWYSTGDGIYYPAGPRIRKADSGFPCAVRREKIQLNGEMTIVGRRWTWDPCIAYPRIILGLWDAVQAEAIVTRAKDDARGRVMRERSERIDEMVARLVDAGVETKRVFTFDGDEVALRMSEYALRRLVALIEVEP